MKNIKYLALSLSLLIMMASCGDDDFSRAYVDNEVKTELSGVLEFVRNSAAPTTMVDFTVTIPQSFSDTTTVQVTGTTLLTTSPLFDEVKTFATAIVLPGQTTGSGRIEMPGHTSDTSDFNGIGDYASFSLTGLAITQPAEGSVDDPYVLSSDAVVLRALNYNNDYMAPRDDAMKFLLDWEDPAGNDLDMYVFNATTFAQVESAETGSRYEGDWFNDFHPDGDYFVAINFWFVVGTDIPYNFTFTYPDGSVDFYEGVFTNTGTLGFEFPIINITKSTDLDGNAVYSTSLP